MEYIENFDDFVTNTQTNKMCSESLILEHRNDLKPIICIIIG